jgi:hypothetical protein
MSSETITTTENSPAVKPQTSTEVTGSTSESETYTKSQVEELSKKAVRDALAEAGRKHKTEIESAITKAQETQTATIKEHVDRIAALEADLDEMAKDDADKTDVLKLKRELRAEKDSLKKDRDSYKQEKESHDKVWEEHQTTIKEAQSEKFALTAWDIADEFEGGDAVKLKDICEDAGQLTEEFARKMAGRLWTKKTEIKKPLVDGKPDPGGTQGGANSWESIRDAWIKNQQEHPTNPDPVLTAQYEEARRKRGI